MKEQKQLESIINRYEELTAFLEDPQIVQDQDRYLKIVKEHADLEEIVQTARKFQSSTQQLESNKSMLYESDTDEELRSLIKEENVELTAEIEQLTEQIQILLLPKDPRDDKNVIVEIRGGAGGEEAALFGEEMYRMYNAYAERRGFKTELLSLSETDLGGMKEVVFNINGQGAFSRLKYEMGVHRVQRVPVTESGGRVHTSTITVAVMPEVEEVDLNINPNDLEIDTYRASGAGGQHINKTDSAIRITHKPSGVVVTCQDQRSQHKNKDKAMTILRTRLYEMEQEKLHKERSDQRKNQVGTGDRSERIRTYNYPQNRVTDHRIGLTLYRLEDILAGDLDLVVDPLIMEERSRQLSEGEQGEN